jgi:predicted nucleic acid-binding protein
LAVLTKHRVYVETTIIADWLLVETFPKKRLNKLTPEVRASHELIEFLLQRKNDEILPYTSYWAIFESVGVIKRTNIEVWLALDGIPSVFYHELKNDPKYALQPHQIKKINKLVHKLVSEEKNSNPIKLLPEQSDIKMGVSLILERNLEAPDSFHLGVASSLGCNLFVTKDHHYQTCEKSFRGNIRILKASELIEMLTKEGFMPSKIKYFTL